MSRFAKTEARLVTSRSFMVALGETTTTLLTAGIADAEARVPKASTAKETILVKENMIRFENAKVMSERSKRKGLAKIKLDKVPKEVRKEQDERRLI